jgi:hypothetical protein
VRDKVLHPYKTTGKMKVLYILIFTFLDSRREEKNSELHGSKHLTTTHKTTSNGNAEFLHPYSVVVADALLEIGTAVISALCRSMSTCHR